MSPKTFKAPNTSYQDKYRPTSLAKSSYLTFLTSLSISSHKTSGRAASVLCSILPSNTMDDSVNSVCSVNSVNSYVARTKPLSFKTTPLVPKPLSTLNLMLVEQFLMEQFLI